MVQESGPGMRPRLRSGVGYPVAMTHVLPEGQFLTRMGIGAVFGLLIGFERQWRGRAAGLHTTGLVAGGAAAFAAIGPVIGAGPGDRIIANIVTGVGFLAGGVILRQGTNITGLNTAATIWATAAVGALTGAGVIREAAAATAGIILINLVMDPFGRAVDARRHVEKPPD